MNNEKFIKIIKLEKIEKRKILENKIKKDWKIECRK